MVLNILKIVSYEDGCQFTMFQNIVDMFNCVCYGNKNNDYCWFCVSQGSSIRITTMLPAG
jgi:hypothetical protein